MRLLVIDDGSSMAKVLLHELSKADREVWAERIEIQAYKDLESDMEEKKHKIGIKPEMVGDLAVLKKPTDAYGRNGHYRDLSLHKELELEKRFGKNWKKRMREEAERAREAEELQQRKLDVATLEPKS